MMPKNTGAQSLHHFLPGKKWMHTLKGQRAAEVISHKDMNSSIQLQLMSKPAMLTPPPFLTKADHLSLSVIIKNNN